MMKYKLLFMFAFLWGILSKQVSHPFLKITFQNALTKFFPLIALKKKILLRDLTLTKGSELKLISCVRTP